MLHSKNSLTRMAMAAGTIAAVSVLAACAGMAGARRQTGMSFFVTSAGPGKGADLGGLAGADKHCQALATAAGAGNRTWRAYLSTQRRRTMPGQCARPHRQGPWHNAKGVVVARPCRRPARRQQQLDQADRADREGRRRQRPRRHAQHARHAHRLAARRHASRRRGHAPAATGPAAATARPCSATTTASASTTRRRQVLELVAPVARLQPADALKATGGAGLFYCFAAD